MERGFQIDDASMVMRRMMELDTVTHSVIFTDPSVEGIEGDKCVFRRAGLLNVGYEVCI